MTVSEAVVAHVGHKHCAVADPNVSAEADFGEDSALGLTAGLRAARRMLAPAAEDVHVAADAGQGWARLDDLGLRRVGVSVQFH